MMNSKASDLFTSHGPCMGKCVINLKQLIQKLPIIAIMSAESAILCQLLICYNQLPMSWTMDSCLVGTAWGYSTQYLGD